MTSEVYTPYLCGGPKGERYRDASSRWQISTSYR